MLTLFCLANTSTVRKQSTWNVHAKLPFTWYLARIPNNSKLVMWHEASHTKMSIKRNQVPGYACVSILIFRDYLT